MTLENEIKKVDAQYDLCNEAWARGEADKFATDELLDWLVNQTMQSDHLGIRTMSQQRLSYISIVSNQVCEGGRVQNESCYICVGTLDTQNNLLVYCLCWYI